jgi:hypothetical protein
MMSSGDLSLMRGWGFAALFLQNGGSIMSDENYAQEGLSFTSAESGRISETHPLRQLFGALVDGAFLNTVGCYDSEVSGYLANILTDFTHVCRIYKVKNLAGKPLTEVADMLVEADVRLNAMSFNREREVHKHIGDFTLFWTGLYPDALPTLQSQCRHDHLLDYIEQGKSSYAIAASHDYGAYRQEAKVLKRISDNFEVCLYGLNAVRSKLGHSI